MYADILSDSSCHLVLQIQNAIACGSLSEIYIYIYIYIRITPWNFKIHGNLFDICASVFFNIYADLAFYLTQILRFNFNMTSLSDRYFRDSDINHEKLSGALCG